MAKKIILELTAAQFEALIEITNNISAINNGNTTWTKYVKLIDRMLFKNGYKRKFN